LHALVNDDNCWESTASKQNTDVHVAQGNVIAHTGVCRKLHQLLPDAGNIRIEVRPGSRVSSNSLRRFLSGVGSGAHKTLGWARRPARKRLGGKGGGEKEGGGQGEGEGRVELVVHDAVALKTLVCTVRASLVRIVSLDLRHLVKLTSPPETLHRMCELMEACGSKLVALDLCSNELLPRHMGQLAERLPKCSNLQSLSLAHNRLELIGLTRLACACASLSQVISIIYMIHICT